MRNRSVIELMVLVFTFIIAFCIIGLGLLIIIVEVKDPKADTSLLASLLASLVSGILGALLGLLAGKNNTGGEELHTRPGERDK